MKKKSAEENSIFIASLIAQEAPYIEYSDEQVKQAEEAMTPAETQMWRDLGMLGDDYECFYVLRRFCDSLNLWEAADMPYLRTLFRQAKRFTPEGFMRDDYLKSIHIPTVRKGDFLLTEVPYERGEFFQYRMPDFDAANPVPYLGFCSGRVTFPSIYEGTMPWMSVCPSEISSMEDAMFRAHGSVLVLGLGLGYYPHRIAQNDKVSGIVIVERQPEIIELFNQYILPGFPKKEKISVIQADAYRYLDDVQDGQFDFCFADIWEGAQDGEIAYRRLQPYVKKLPHTEFAYWIEDAIRND